MRRHHPDHQRDIPISMAVHWQLVGASIRTAFEKEDWEIAAEAIDEWVRRHDPEGVPMPAHKGYQWKSLFLPDGTVLRTVLRGKNHHCVVESDQILYNGQPVSPSGFVNAVGGIRRNAWRSTWVLFPDSKQWQLADALRQRKQPRRTHRSATASLKSPPATPPCPSDEGAAVAVARPLPAPQTHAAQSSSEKTYVQDAQAQDAEPNHPSHAGAQRSPHTISRSRPPCQRGADRRGGMTTWLSPALRDELLRLLSLLCAPYCNGGDTSAGITGSSSSG